MTRDTSRTNKHKVSGLLFIIFYFLFSMTLASCVDVKVPDQFTDVKKTAPIYPDYTDVTIPVNIAPLTFELEDSCDEMVARFTVGDHKLVCGGDAVQPDMDDWRELINKAIGKDISVEVFARTDDAWKRYQPFHITVSADSIDPYISYRLISPSYVAYEELTLNQRCLENYDEQVMGMFCALDASECHLVACLHT